MQPTEETYSCYLSKSISCKMEHEFGSRCIHGPFQARQNKQRNAPITFNISIHPSVCLSAFISAVSTGSFSLHQTVATSTKICRKTPNLIKIGHFTQTLEYVCIVESRMKYFIALRQCKITHSGVSMATFNGSLFLTAMCRLKTGPNDSAV